MGFQEEVNKVRDGILSKNMYKMPLQALEKRINDVELNSRINYEFSENVINNINKNIKKEKEELEL